ncbi:hypothetical protein [Actinoplanes utahensis]|uniref:hypothetical protein n=1 Tax=Actinoplanes utahensis TaxID=1869 RepID=UPI00068FAF65|nr:hypothetical protein [Actinoplanes utahensis]
MIMSSSRRRWALPTAVAAVAAVAAPPAPAHATGAPATLTAAQRTVLIEATKRFQDVTLAEAAGYLPTEDCVPGMGRHYVHPGLAADPAVDPTRPEVLLYDRRRELLGIEFFKADTDGSLTTDSDRPTLFGNRFDGPMTGHPVPHGAPPMPVHYDLHVWLYRSNPDGVLATVNPRVTCP